MCTVIRYSYYAPRIGNFATENTTGKQGLKYSTIGFKYGTVLLTDFPCHPLW